MLKLRESGLDLVDLLFQNPRLPLFGDGDALKLAVADDNGVVVPGGNPGAELLSIGCLEVLLGRDQEVGRGIEPQKLRRPLLGQMVGDDKHTLLTQPQALALHGRRHHFKGLACPHFVSKQGVAAVEDVGNGVFLVFSQLDLRVHAAKDDVAAVILPGTGTVKLLVVLGHQSFPAAGIFPEPVLEGVLHGLLLLLCQGGGLLVNDAALLAIGILHGVVDTDVLEVQRLLQNLVGVGTVCAVGHVGGHVVGTGHGLASDPPLGGDGGILHLDGTAHIVGRVKGLHHELLNVLRLNPRCAQPGFDF